MFPRDPAPLRGQHVEVLCNEYIYSTHLAMIQQQIKLFHTSLLDSYGLINYIITY